MPSYSPVQSSEIFFDRLDLSVVILGLILYNWPDMSLLFLFRRLFATLACALLAGLALAQDYTLSGQISNLPAGVTAPTGSYDVVVRILAADGSTSWSEIEHGVSFSGGSFSIHLAGSTALRAAATGGAKVSVELIQDQRVGQSFAIPGSNLVAIQTEGSVDKNPGDYAKDATTNAPILVIVRDDTTASGVMGWLYIRSRTAPFYVPKDNYLYTSVSSIKSVGLEPGQALTVRVVHVSTSTGAITATFGSVTPSMRVVNDGTKSYSEFLVYVPDTTGTELDVNENGTAIYKIDIGPAPKADFSTQVGALYVVQSGSHPAFGLRTPTYTLSRKLTLDVVTIYSGGTNASLGGALTYRLLLGNSYEPTNHTIFGFPAALTFSVGFTGLDFGQVNNAGHAFYAFGISVPTGKP